MSIDTSNTSSICKYFHNKIQYNFNSKCFNNQKIIYCNAANDQGNLGNIRILIQDNTQLEVNIKELNKKNNDKNILLARMIDRAIRPTGNNYAIKITILSKGSNIMELCHFGVFFGISHKIHLGFSNMNGIQMCVNRKGILSIEALLEKHSWKLSNKIIKNYQSAIKFIEFLEKHNRPLNLKKTSDVKAEDGENLLQYNRPEVSGYLAYKDTRIDSHRSNDEIRNINIDIEQLGNQTRVDFQRGTTYVSSVGAIQHNNGNYSTRYDFSYGRHRRNIGHTNLIYKTINSIIPKDIHLSNISEVLDSDGSSSMASVCAESLILAHLGLIDKSELIGGLSFGLFRYKDKSTFITDMTAKEDNYSEIDCKLTANKKGIVSIQLDVKTHITTKEITDLIIYSKDKLETILKIMRKSIKTTYNKRYFNNNIIGNIIGKSGKNINSLKEKSKIKKLIVYGNWIVYNKNNPIIEEMLNFYDPKIKDTIIFQIKNLEPLATVMGKINNTGQYTDLSKNQMFRGTVENWSKNNKDVKILEKIDL